MSTKLSPPWYEFYREINALFEKDKEISTTYDEDNNVIKIFVDNDEKAVALSQLLPTERVFGAITVKVDVIPANAGNSRKIDLFRTAFEGNGALSCIETVEGVFTNPISYVVFENKVVQYYNDNLGDIHGNRSTLYQEIAKDIFKDTDGIYFCTDIPKE